MPGAETRTCQNCKSRFTIEPDDFSFYARLRMPPPTFCPDCRKQRRLSWRNDMSLNPRTCGLCGKPVVSIYHPDSRITVYCPKCWWSDKWDPKALGRDYDPSRTFFEQFAEFQRAVPYLAMVNDDGIGSVNIEYTQDFARAKNCYMTFIGWKVEDCLYDFYLVGGREIVDSFDSWENQYVYESIRSERCYGSRYIYDCAAVTDSAFMYDCRDCSNCFLCVGLRHRQYCFKNEQYSKEEFEKILASYRLDTWSGTERAKKEFRELWNLKPRRFAEIRNSVNCTGDNLLHCKNSQHCFNIGNGEDCKWVENADTPKNCYDLSVGGELQYVYESITPDNSYESAFEIFSWKNTSVLYVDACHSSKDIFGCVGLKKAQYCVLNKQYPKTEYENLVQKIRADMDSTPYTDKNGAIYKFGDFFPAELSYFKYNESSAQNYFPKTEAECGKAGLGWRKDFQVTRGKATTEEPPDAIADVHDSITGEILACADCGRNYRIVPAELTFYRKFSIPVPRRCFYCRHQARLAIANPYRLWRRRCECAGAKSGKEYANTREHTHGRGHCPQEFETPYAPDRPEIVYCEECYNAEVA